MATSNNPRKFSEKIALHNQKQAEETAAFEEVMKDLSITRAARVRVHISFLRQPVSHGQQAVNCAVNERQAAAVEASLVEGKQ